jgi:hypothetical protein
MGKKKLPQKNKEDFTATILKAYFRMCHGYEWRDSGVHVTDI